MCMIFSQCNTYSMVIYLTIQYQGECGQQPKYLFRQIASNGSVLMTVRYASGRRTIANIIVTVPMASHVL